MNQNDDFTELQKLLQLKRLETPGKEYFERFVDAFHQYQRREILRDEPWYARVVEVLFEPWLGGIPRLATVAAAAACLLAGIAFFLGPVGAGSAQLANGKVAHARGIMVASNQSDDSIQIQPELIETSAGGEGTQLRPLYVNGHGAVAYDSRLAF
ncbi:MAG: hypothetical protein NTZ01_02220 [Verrucomicrobia bacterium]|nr:hypothetical protein [Verrucomicrobiota bacterium]